MRVCLLSLCLILLPPSLAWGKIVHFTDSRGVLHINTSGAQQPQGNPQRPVATGVVPPNPPPGLHLQPRPELNQTKPPPAQTPLPAGPATVPDGVIRIYTDKTGKIEAIKGVRPVPVPAIDPSVSAPATAATPPGTSPAKDTPAIDESSLQHYHESREALTFSHIKPISAPLFKPAGWDGDFYQGETADLTPPEPTATADAGAAASAIVGFLGDTAILPITNADLKAAESWAAAMRQNQTSEDIMVAAFNPLPDRLNGSGSENVPGTGPPVSWPSGPIPAASQAPRLSFGKITLYRGPKGIIHITNSPRGPVPLAAPVAPAAVPASSPPPAPALPSALRSVSWSPPTLGVKAANVAPLTDPRLLGEATIQRYRDNHGVWHITNNAPAEPKLPGASPATPEISQPRLHVSQAAPVRPPAAYAWMQAAGMSALQVSGPTTVIARRDSHGTLHIFNAPFGEAGLRAANPLAFLGKVNQRLEAIIQEAARTYRLPPALVLAVIRMESNFAPRAVSPKGAMGLMQLMPGTASELGVRDAFCPRENIMAGCRYLRWLLDNFQGSLPLALAAYNAGHQRVVAAGYHIPPIQETQEFVTQVIGLYYLMQQTGRPM
jgi:soluble lytic murein transglycosylase-like protein